MLKKVLKGIKWFFISLLGIIVLFILICMIGRGINRITPKNGINESKYIDINGTKQWISIYSENKDNPVLLYIHGGPFYPTSAVDFPMMKKLGKDYTVVNWDQRGVGHNYKIGPVEEATPEIMIKDGQEITKYLKETFGVDKIMLWGSSWGSALGERLISENPENYYAFLGTSAVWTTVEKRKAFKEEMLEKYKDDKEVQELLNRFDPEVIHEDEAQHELTRELRKRCCEDDNLTNSADFNIWTSFMFNPYASPKQIYLMFAVYFDKDVMANRNTLTPDDAKLIDTVFPTDVTEYEIPVYYLLGKKDEQPGTNYKAMEKYINSISAPDKEIRYVDGGHFAATIQSETIKDYLHDIKEKNILNK
ncbi:MAG: alpha/beta hydrolase [Eubacterium sp.]|nr:alpha/beta hydrolase [Eubacterium sp.]